MKIALINNDGLIQAYVQLTTVEAERVRDFLSAQIKKTDAAPAAHSERVTFEDFIKNRNKPETSKGLLTLAIVEN